MDAANQADRYKCKGIKRLCNAFLNSLKGLRAAFKYEAAFRQEILLACILIPVALFFSFPFIHKVMMIASVLLVLIVELINSAIETICDYISMDDHPLAKRAKDLGSSAVFLSLVNLSFVWIFILLNKL